MQKPQITAYLKTSCGWSKGVRALFSKYDLPYTDKDIVLNPDFRNEMVLRTGQPLSPCVEINGVMLTDVSGEEVETYLLAQGLLQKNDDPTSFPINTDCSGKHQHSTEHAM